MFWKRIKNAFSSQKLPSTISILVVLIGSTALTILSLLNRVTDDIRTSGILAILTFMAFSEVLERIGSLSNIEEDISSIKNSLGIKKSNLIQATNFTPFEEFVGDSKDVLIVGLTKIGVIVQRMNFFQKLIGRNGSNFRVVLLDPTEEKLFKVVSYNLEIDEARFLTDITQTLETLKRIRRNLSPKENARLKIRLFSGSPGLGLILVDGNKPTGRLQTYFYTYKTDPPNRPGFEIYREEDPEWFDYFVTKYELMWKEIETGGKPDPTLNTEGR